MEPLITVSKGFAVWSACSDMFYMAELMRKENLISTWIEDGVDVSDLPQGFWD